MPQGRATWCLRREDLCSNDDVIFFAAKKMTSSLLHKSSPRRPHVVAFSNSVFSVSSYLLRVVKKLTSILIAGFRKFNKNYPNEPMKLL